MKKIIICFLLVINFAITSIASEAQLKVSRDHLLPSLIKSARYSGSDRLCGEKIPLSSQDVRERLEKEILLALWDRAQVILWIKRASKYFPHIEKILKDERLPDDLKYVAVIESSLRPNAGSSKGAVGFWQFISSTGKKYNLRVDRSIDERRSLFKSTRAACKYFKKLYNQFGSWTLAMAAYNMGEYGLQSEIRMQENKDYYSLYLYLETQRYVFKVIAAKEILENPEKYGFNYSSQDLYPVLDFSKAQLNIKDKIPLTLIAKSANTTFKMIKDLNPEIRGYHLVPGVHAIYLPAGTSKGFNEAFSNHYASWKKTHAKKNTRKAKRATRQYHVVRKGEGLSMIANRYRISLSKLLKWNKLHRKSIIHPGDRLIIGMNK